MLKDRPLRIEVLINSPGPHDQVRVRQPFLALQALGVDCRIHERPFLFNSCIRPHSLVIWQRPLPASWQRQIEHLQWLRQRGCLLLTEWDDHPALFPSNIRDKLNLCSMAPLVACHAIHGSSVPLASALRAWNPLTVCLENGVDPVTAINEDKHRSNLTRIFIGNQNRETEHYQLIIPLQRWLKNDQKIIAVIVGDSDLANKIARPNQIERYPLLSYTKYRDVLRTCQIALLPLKKGNAERCKTVIKWAEAAAESVAVVAGPELYPTIQSNSLGDTTCCIGKDIEDIVTKARELSLKREQRIKQVRSAYKWVEQEWALNKLLPHRLALYNSLWQRRQKLDSLLITRLSGKAPLLTQSPFIK